MIKIVPLKDVQAHHVYREFYPDIKEFSLIRTNEELLAFIFYYQIRAREFCLTN